jgi:transposase
MITMPRPTREVVPKPTREVVPRQRALIDLGIGLWRSDPAARRYGQQLRARGKKGRVIGCAMANRANRIAYALVRDQTGYEPDRWA